MKRGVLGLLAVGVIASCSNGACWRNSSCCSETAELARDQAYVGRFSMPDAGSTAVRLVVSSSGETHLVFVRDGVTVDERFNATSRF